MALFWKKHRSKIIIAIAVVVLLGVAWMQGGGATSNEPTKDPFSEMPVSEAPVATTLPTDTPPADTPTPAEEATTEPIIDATTDPTAEPTAEPTMAPTEKPIIEITEAPTTEPIAESTPAALTCTLIVRCDTILSNMGDLHQEKAELVPSDGVIFQSTSVTFYENENVFNILQREMRRSKIHLEFVNTPLYDSAYIEGIGNLYELDCGKLSGWMYKVNGVFPQYGCTRYILQPGDVVEWVYTCDLGRDVGGDGAIGGAGGAR